MAEMMSEGRAVVVNVDWKHGGQWGEQVQELKSVSERKIGK